MTGTGYADMLEMAVMGLDTAVVAPAMILVTRRTHSWRLLTAPAWFALPFFLLVHAAVTMWMAVTMPAPAADLLVHIALVGCSLVFWLPVLGPSSRLSDGARIIYLFLAMPTMDLAGVFVVLHGDAAGGLAMIVAMLPVGVAAVVMAWRWIIAEERAAAMADAVPVQTAARGSGPWAEALR